MRIGLLLLCTCAFAAVLASRDVIGHSQQEVEQASGGIVTPPTGGEVEHYDSVLLSSSGSTISGVGAGVAMVFQAWYSLSNASKEARITESISMKDNNSSPKTFARTVYVNVGP